MHAKGHTSDAASFENKEREDRLKILHEKLRERGMLEEASLLLEEIPERSTAKSPRKAGAAEEQGQKTEDNRPLWKQLREKTDEWTTARSKEDKALNELVQAKERMEKCEVQAFEAHIAAEEAEKTYNKIRESYANSTKTGREGKDEDEAKGQEEIDEEAERISKNDPIFANELRVHKEKRATLEAAKLEAARDEQNLRERVQQGKREREQREEQEARRAKEEATQAKEKSDREEQEARRRTRAGTDAAPTGGQAPSKKAKGTGSEVDSEKFSVDDDDTSGHGVASASGSGTSRGTLDSAGAEARKQARRDQLEEKKRMAQELIKKQAAETEAPRAPAM